jgi:hypothetical protein
MYCSNYFCSVGKLFGFDAATPPTPNRYKHTLQKFFSDYQSATSSTPTKGQLVAFQWTKVNWKR